MAVRHCGFSGIFPVLPRKNLPQPIVTCVHPKSVNFNLLSVAPLFSIACAMNWNWGTANNEEMQ
jgi:hypothetical protein